MRLDYGTKKENRATVAQIAKEALAEHSITPEQTEGPVRMWYCGRKGTGMYSYRVIAAPNMLLVYGDVGDYILQVYDKDLVPWLRGAIKSENYLISKMINKGEVFMPKEAVKLLDDLVNEAKEYDHEVEYDRDEDDEEIEGIHTKEARELKRKVLDEWDKDYGGYEEFAEAFHCAGGESSLTDRTIDYESSVYWTVECLKRFVELLDAKDDKGDSICSSLVTLIEEK